jgi:hypothetical protein
VRLHFHSPYKAPWRRWRSLRKFNICLRLLLVAIHETFGRGVRCARGGKPVNTTTQVLEYVGRKTLTASRARTSASALSIKSNGIRTARLAEMLPLRFCATITTAAGPWVSARATLTASRYSTWCHIVSP